MTGSRSAERVALIDRLPASFVERFAAAAVAPPSVKARDEQVRGYARYSAESSKESSIERQHEQSAAYAMERLGMKIKTEHSDRAVSGTTMVGRLGLLKALKDAREGKFKILVIEDVDRLARTVALACNLYDEFKRAGVEIHSTTKMGKLDDTDIILRGFFSAQQLDRLKFLTRMGRAKAVAEKRSPCGPCWGLLRVPFKPGEAVIDVAVKPIIEWMFEIRLAGVSKRKIARLLNARGVKSPRGGTWCTQTVAQVLRNPRRAGVFIFGRSAHALNVETGKTDVEKVPASEWAVVEIAEWKIVEYADWLAVQAMDADYREAKAGVSLGGRKKDAPEALLSRLVRCHGCGSTLVIRTMHKSRNTPVVHYQCSKHRDHGGVACPETRTYMQRDLEEAVTGIVRGLLEAPEAQEAFVTTLNEERSAAIAELESRRLHLETRVAGLRKEVLAEMAAARRLEGFPDDMIIQERRDLSARYDDARAELVALPDPPDAFVRDGARVESLIHAFDTFTGRAPIGSDEDGTDPLPADVIEEARSRGIAAFHGLIDRVVCQPFPASRSFGFSVDIRLGRLLEDGNAAEDVGLGTHTLSGIHHPLPRKGAVPLDLTNEAAALVQSRRYFATDREAALIIPLIPPAAVALRSREGALDARGLVDALMHCLRTGLSPSQYDAAFGCEHGKAIRLSFKRLVYGGYWTRIAATLQASDPGACKEFAMRYFDGSMNAAARYPYRRTERGFDALPASPQKPRRRKSARALAAAVSAMPP